MSEETRRKISVSHMGVTPSAETRARMSASGKGKHSGPASGKWVGDAVGYQGAHHRMRAALAESACGCCGSTSDVDCALRHDAQEVREDRVGRYSVNQDDYWPLCRPCHKTYDTSSRDEWDRHVETHKVAA